LIHQRFARSFELMARSVNQGALQLWRDRFLQFDKSPLTVARFCKSIRVSVATFYYWKQKLENETVSKGEVPEGAQGVARSRIAAPNSRAFVPVFIDPRPVIAPRPDGGQVTVELACGSRIRVPCEAVAVLRVLVQELQMRDE
jgi:hypothetical protein